MEEPTPRTTLDHHATTPRKGTRWGTTCITRWEEVAGGARNMGTMNIMEG